MGKDSYSPSLATTTEPPFRRPIFADTAEAVCRIMQFPIFADALR